MQRSTNLLKSFSYAFQGIKTALKYNRNLRIHFVIAALVIILSSILKISAFEFSVVLIVILFVIVAEMMNSVIEEMVNLIIKEHAQEAKIAKDVAAGMVLVAAIGSIIVGLLILLPRLLPL